MYLRTISNNYTSVKLTQLNLSLSALLYSKPAFHFFEEGFQALQVFN